MDNRGRTARGHKRMFAAAFLVTTAITGAGLALSQAGAADAVTGAATPPLGLAPVVNQAGFGDLAAKVRPAVVNIATTGGVEQVADQPGAGRQRLMPNFPPGSSRDEMFRRFNGEGGMRPRPMHGQGSGFIVDPAGYIVTNNHVVDHAQKIMVTLDDGTTYPAKVVGSDPRTDLSVLKIDAGKPVPYVAFGDSAKERVGDWVIAVGNPFGLGGTVTAGIVSAHDRDLNSGPYDGYLQIDAPINPGNSGGPLFNQSGQVIGIDTAIYSPSGGSVGIGFAIPSNTAMKVVAQLREHGKVERGWLGIAMQPLTPALAAAIGHPDVKGVIVNSVEANSPAATAELKQGDVIAAFNGEAIKTPRDLAVAVANSANGSDAKLTVWRDGQERVMPVAIGKSGAEVALQSEEASSSPVGLALAPLNEDTREQLGLNPSTEGVVVAQVMPGSRADDSGVQSGDVIVRIGSKPVTTPADAATKIHAAERDKKEAVPLLVMRNGSTYYLALQLGKG